MLSNRYSETQTDGFQLDKSGILRWLRETDPSRLLELWRQADAVRQANVGAAVHLRGLIEISNICRRQCAYCGIRAGNAALPRYRMPADEVLACARLADKLGYGTVVIQGGEDPGLSAEWFAGILRQIKAETPLAITLSLGERETGELALWRDAGADRYLLRFETSNPDLFAAIHPAAPGSLAGRLALLGHLRALGYEIGSGVMVGIPGQTYDDLAADLLLFRELDLDMIGLGPFLPHPQTPLARAAERSGGPDQPPNNELMTYKMLALTRIMCPKANIPSTTALASLNAGAGRELGFRRGANVVMPNLTPRPYRQLYEIYPAKARVTDDAVEFHNRMLAGIIAAGREIGCGRGDSPARLSRQNWPASHG